MSYKLTNTMDKDYNTPNTYVSRSDSLFIAISRRHSDNFVADADKETQKKKADVITAINTEIERRKTAFENI